MFAMSIPGRRPSLRGPSRSRASSSLRMKSISPRSCSRGTTGRPRAQAHRLKRNPVRPRRETMSCLKPAFSVHRTFILHAKQAKLPSDLLGLTCVRYDEAATAAQMRVINEKLRKAIENEGRLVRIEGMWWQFSLTERGPNEPSAVSLLRIARDRDGALEMSGRSRQEDGSLSAR